MRARVWGVNETEIERALHKARWGQGRGGWEYDDVERLTGEDCPIDVADPKAVAAERGEFWAYAVYPVRDEASRATGGPDVMPVVVQVWGLTDRDRGEAETDARRFALDRGHEVAAIEQRIDPLPSARDWAALAQQVVYGKAWAVYPQETP
jgi:hypothetical protein